MLTTSPNSLTHTVDIRRYTRGGRTEARITLPKIYTVHLGIIPGDMVSIKFGDEIFQRKIAGNNTITFPSKLIENCDKVQIFLVDNTLHLQFVLKS